MSRAFVRQDSDAPDPPPPERAVSAAPNLVTARGARLILQTITELKAALARAPDEAAAVLPRRDLRYWHARQATMKIVTPAPADVIGFGCRVTVRRGAAGSVVTIVGEDEADPPVGLIAWTAPLARALDGAAVGDVVELDAGGRREAITVEAIAAGD